MQTCCCAYGPQHRIISIQGVTSSHCSPAQQENAHRGTQLHPSSGTTADLALTAGLARYVWTIHPGHAPQRSYAAVPMQGIESSQSSAHSHTQGEKLACMRDRILRAPTSRITSTCSLFPCCIKYLLYPYIGVQTAVHSHSLQQTS